MSAGFRGCCGMTKRHGKLPPCAQKAIVQVDGKWYCYYHNPLLARKFGEGYRPRTDKEDHLHVSAEGDVQS